MQRINEGLRDRLARRSQGTIVGRRLIEAARLGPHRVRRSGETPIEPDGPAKPSMTIDTTELELDEPRKRVGVIAREASVTPEQWRTLDALEHVFPVRFEPAGSLDPSAADGVLVLGPPTPSAVPAGVPRLMLPAVVPLADSRVGGRAVDAAVTSAEATTVVLAHTGLARPLRGAAISEGALAEETPPDRALAGETPPKPALAGEAPPDPALDTGSGPPLASVAGRPVWWQLGAEAAAQSVSTYPLAALRDGEALRDHLRAGCFMGLLPLVHFLGQVLGADGWTPPPLRASFVIDDPNLHWSSYGFLKYGELIAHASRHGYHVGLATIPLDGWLVNRRAAALVRENPAAISLLMHGNDHVARELGRLSTAAKAEAAIAQALRRIAVLERRSGVAVERVMAPPHGACSEAALRAMFGLGVEAACISRPYPWRDGLPAPTALAGWHPAELVAGGLPVLPRYPLGHPREDLALRALLGQPLILYGHHGDFAQGLDLFAQAAADVNGLGEVQWGPLGRIARGNYATRRVGEVLHVRMYARRIELEVPGGVRTLRVVAQAPHGGPAWRRLTHMSVRTSEPGGAHARGIEPGNAHERPSATGPTTDRTHGVVGMSFADGVGVSEPMPVAASTGIELALAADRPLDPALLATRGVRPWPCLRRALVEGRDRIQPLLRSRVETA
jgi:hypothetical protein